MWNTKSKLGKEDIEKRVHAGYYKNLNESVDMIDNNSISKLDITGMDSRAGTRENSPELDRSASKEHNVVSIIEGDELKESYYPKLVDIGDVKRPLSTISTYKKVSKNPDKFKTFYTGPILKAMSIETLFSDKKPQDEAILTIFNYSQHEINVYHVDNLKEKNKIFDVEPESNRRHFTICGYQLLIQAEETLIAAYKPPVLKGKDRTSFAKLQIGISIDEH